LVFGERKKRPWSEISKPYAASTTTAYQLGAKIRFSPNKCGSRATLTKSLAQHPIKNLTCFDLEESEVFNGSDWNNPVISKYGVKVCGRGDSERRYISNYYKLRNLVERKLDNCQNVIVHNPWGEYGNEEHIQVYRVVKELQDKIHFDIWFPGYFSNKSIKLMSRYVHEIGPEHVI
jgi:hypothetical protein